MLGLSVIPLLTFTIGCLLLYLPQVNRALWRSASLQAHLTAGAVAGHRYALAALDAIGVALVALSLAGSRASSPRRAGRASVVRVSE